MVPDNLLYTKDHEWLQIDGDTAVVGVTDYAQHEMGDVVHVDPAAIGKTLAQGESLAVIETVKAANDVYAPVGGTVLAHNPLLENTPEIINTDAFGQGWVLKLKVAPGTSTAHLLSAAAYKELIGV